MHNISQQQLLTLWTELMRCYYGDNSYAGDTCEIYAYTLQPMRPVAVTATGTYGAELRAELATQAGKSLVAVLNKFCTDMKCKVTIEDHSILEWYQAEPAGQFTTRAHIKVIPYHKLGGHVP
jgi:hypothetical protein